MKLTYRGVNYQAPVLKTPINLSETTVSLEQKIQAKHQPENKPILVRPIHYYTYRGVSYTKNLFFDSNTKHLINIDRH